MNQKPKTIDAGGPAFPQAVSINAKAGEFAYGSAPGGMTLRQFYAGLALAGMCANPGCCGYVGGFAMNAFKYADAMLEHERGAK